MDPLRGEVWDCRLPQIGEHPVVVLTINPLLRRLRSATVVIVTGTEGPTATHIQLDSAAGLTRYDVSYANATDVHTVALGRLRLRRGLLHPAELMRIEEALRITLGL